MFDRSLDSLFQTGFDATKPIQLFIKSRIETRMLV